jgi:hypothetical protein
MMKHIQRLNIHTHVRAAHTFAHLVDKLTVVVGVLDFIGRLRWHVCIVVFGLFYAAAYPLSKLEREHHVEL